MNNKIKSIKNYYIDNSFNKIHLSESDSSNLNDELTNRVNQSITACTWLESTKAVSASINGALYVFSQDFEKHASKNDIAKYIGIKSYQKKTRESFWIRAVQNLYKRINFLQLNIDFLNEFISEEEFEIAISEQEDKYVITFKELRNHYEAQAINDIIQAIGLDLATNEVAELFGVEPDSLYQAQSKQQALSAHG